MGGCKNKKLIGPYLDGALKNGSWLESHIDECAECLAEYEMIQRLYYLARKADLAPPESAYWRSFSNRTLARVMGRIPQQNQIRIGQSMVPLLSRWLWAGALIALILTLILIPLRLSDKPPAITAIDDSADEMAITTDDSQSISGQNDAPIKPIAIRPFENELPSVVSNPPLAPSSNIRAGDIPAKNDQPAGQLSWQTPELRGGWRQGETKTISMLEHDLKMVDVSDRLGGQPLDATLVLRLQIAGNPDANMVPLQRYRERETYYLNPNRPPKSGVGPELKPTKFGYAAGNNFADKESRSRYEFELRLIENK